MSQTLGISAPPKTPASGMPHVRPACYHGHGYLDKAPKGHTPNRWPTKHNPPLPARFPGAIDA